MSLPEEKTRRRIHIGNILPKLKESADALSTRLAKFGKIVSPLEFHTKAVGEYFFAYVDLELNDKDLDKLKVALNGILYMGRKITIGLAKAGFQEAWQKDHGRPGPAEKEIQNKSGIAAARDMRIKESSALGHCNSVSMAPLVKTSLIGANNSSMGYMKSAHMFNDMSGNTKNKSPSHSLVGQKSYGSTLVPKGSFTHQYLWFSGHGDVVKGRVRKTARPAAYFVRKQQTMRLLINGELKQIKCYKTKLWGVDQKSALDLTYRYVDGVWKSGDDHVVERSTGSRKQVLEFSLDKCGISGDQAQVYGSIALAAPAPGMELGAPEDADTLDEERTKNANVLAKLFTTFDFNKETEIEMDDASDEDAVTYDSKGRKTVQRFDFETQGTVAADASDNEDNDVGEMAIIEEYKTSTERPPEEVYYSESDEGNDIDMDALQKLYTTEAIKTQYDEEHEEDEEDEVDDEDEEPEKEAESAEIDEENIEEEKIEEEKNEKSMDVEPEANVSSSSESEDSDDSDSGSDSDDSNSDSDSDSDSDSEPEIEHKNQQDKTVEETAADSDSEEDLMPKFTAPQTNSTTEHLRSLFNLGLNQETTPGFSLAVPEDDIDEDKQAQEEAERQKLLDQIKKKQEEERENQEQKLTNKRKVGLFWSHFESPFLQTQTQLSKIGHVGQKIKLPGEKEDEALENVEGEEDDYEKWFWSMRGTIGRECKKRKREVTRNMKKRNIKAYV